MKLSCVHFSMVYPCRWKQTWRMPICGWATSRAAEVDAFDDLKYVNLPERLLSPTSFDEVMSLFNRTNSQEWVGKIGIVRHDAHSVFASYLIRLRCGSAEGGQLLPWPGSPLVSSSVSNQTVRNAGGPQVNIKRPTSGKYSFLFRRRGWIC